MKNLFYAVIAPLCLCSCCHINKTNILSYSDLQDSLECFIRQARPVEFPEDTPTLFYILFYNDLEEGDDTIAILINGITPLSPVNSQKRIGAGDVNGHICEVIYDGFEHLSEIVVEGNLTLGIEDYKRYGYNDAVFNKPEYEDWYYTSGQHKRVERRAYRISRPNLLERIY